MQTKVETFTMEIISLFTSRRQMLLKHLSPRGVLQSLCIMDILLKSSSSWALSQIIISKQSRTHTKPWRNRISKMRIYLRCASFTSCADLTRIFTIAQMKRSFCRLVSSSQPPLSRPHSPKLVHTNWWKRPPECGPLWVTKMSVQYMIQPILIAKIPRTDRCFKDRSPPFS